jgi:HlyD family secretion protein
MTVKKILIKVLIACLIVGGVGAGGYYGYTKYKANTKKVATVQYMNTTAKKMNLQVTIQGTGSVYAAVSKDVVANNNGDIKDLSLKVGDTVKKGAKICVVTSDQLQQNVNKASNNVQKQNLQLAKAKTDDEITLQNLAISDAQNDLNNAIAQRDKMTVTSPVDGIVIAKNNDNGDTVQANKAILTVVDPTSYKIKVAVDELDIAKVKQGQKAEIKFGAIKDKTYEGTVDTIAQTGTTSNNVTTYDVVVSIKDVSGIKLGMNANVSIQVENKENALVIPTEALVERNGSKFVLIANSDGTNTSSNQSKQKNAEAKATSDGQNNGANQNGSVQAFSGNQGGNGQNIQNSQGNSTNRQKNQNGQSARNASGYTGTAYSGQGKLVQIKTGIENENYIEVTEGLTEGEKVLIALPQVNTNSNNNNMRNNLGGGMGGNFGNFGGQGSTRTQNSGNNSGNNSGKKN